MFRLSLIAALIALSASPTRAQWVDEQTLGVFTFHSEFPLRDVENLVQELGELQKDIESTLDLKCSERTIHIHLFRTRYSYQAYTKTMAPESKNRQALFLADNDAGRVFAFRNRDLETDLRHETTHALLHNALPYVPLWLDEGLAEYFEVPVRQRVEHHLHRQALRNAIRWRGWRPNLAQLEAKRDLADMGGSEYRDAWAWVHFMLHGPPEARAALEEFLITIPTGREPTPLSISLPRRLPNVEQQVLQHLR